MGNHDVRWIDLIGDESETLPDEGERPKPEDVLPASTGETPLRPGPPPPLFRTAPIVVSDVPNGETTPAIGLKALKNVAAHRSSDEQSTADTAALKAAGLYRRTPDQTRPNPDTTAEITLPREVALRQRAERQQAERAADRAPTPRTRVLRMPSDPTPLEKHDRWDSLPPVDEENIPVPTREIIDLPEYVLPLSEDQTDPPLRTEERLIPSYKAINPPPPEQSAEDADDVTMRPSPSFIGRIADFFSRRNRST